MSSDNAGGAATVGRYLLGAGHERIGFVAGPPTASTAREREQGLRTALSHTPAGLDGLVVADGDFGQDRAYAAAREVLQADRPPSAIFGVNDLTAFGVLNAAASLGLRVPEDLWVVGFDDVSMAAWERFDLTTVRQPNDEIARLAVQWMLERISGQRSSPRRHRFPCHLRVRGSTAHAPADPGA